MAERGARFVLWRHEVREGKETKVPLRTNGRLADSTSASSWATLAECEKAAGKLRDVAGIGFVLAAERDVEAGQPPIVGIDLDGCRNPDTGEVEAWARELIDELNSYTEVSPSGTGVKVYASVDPVPQLKANKLVLRPANGSGKPQQIEIFTTSRYFAVTGQHLEGPPDEITDATEAFERLAARVAREAKRKPHNGVAVGSHGKGVPSKATMQRLAEDPALAKLWRGEKEGGDRTASGLDYSLARALSRAGLSFDEIGRVLRQYPHGQLGSGKLTDRQAARRMVQLLEAARTAAESKDERHRIKLEAVHRNATIDKCAELLREVVYLRGTMPAMLARASEISGKHVDDEDGPAVDLNGVRYRPGSLLFVDAIPGRIAWHLNERALFLRYVRRENEWIPEHCPQELAGAIVDNAVFLDFRASAGIVHVPVLVKGELVATPGYHARSGLILDLQGLQLAVPRAPDRQAAEKALQRLLKPFRGYLQNGVADRVALAAAALTAALRPSLGTCPGILIDGNAPGVGKGKLARTLGVINVAGVPAIATEGHSPEEMEKRIAAAVIQGASTLLLDNLQRHIASSTLESMLTEPVADIRTFGKLANLRVACRTLLLLTANNATLRRDMLRRTLPVRIVVPHEKPETRAFDFDPVEEALADRAELLTAAFTIVLAWLRVRDLPENECFHRPLGSFEEWSDLVAGAVAWLTGRNPVDLIEERTDQDLSAADERRVIEALAERYGTEEWTAKEAAKDIDRDLWALVIKFKGDQPDAGTVGRWLRSRKDMVFGRFMLTNEVDRNDVAKWQLRGMRGIAGDSQTSRDEFGMDPTHARNGAKWENAGGSIPRYPPHPPHSLSPHLEEIEL